MMKIVIEIELGNDKMRSGRDVVKAIGETTLGNRDLTGLILRNGDEGMIRDVNGNTVGKWKVML